VIDYLVVTYEKTNARDILTSGLTKFENLQSTHIEFKMTSSDGSSGADKE
jgi:hypothetical protein